MFFKIKNLKSKIISGFTLIEMVVVIGIITLALPAVFAIVFSVLREQAKVYAIKQARREGDFALDSIQNTIKNSAIGIFSDFSLTPAKEVCNSPGPGPSGNLYFKSKIIDPITQQQDEWFEYVLTSNKLASYSGSIPTNPNTTTTVNLTTPQVTVTGFMFSCSRASTYSPALITIYFDVTYSSSSFQENQATLHYSTQIKLTNY